MSKFFSGIASKAAGAINKAKEQIREITTEDFEDDYDQEAKKAIETLKNKCNGYKEQYELLQKSFEELTHLYSEKQDSLIDFKIIVGSPDSPLLLQELEEAHTLNAALKKDHSLLQGELTKAQKLHEQDSLEKSEKLKKAQEASTSTKRDLEEHKNRSKQFQASVGRMVTSCYEQLQCTAEFLGVPIPNMNKENIGLEDIIELLSSQVDYTKDCIHKMVAVLNQNGKKLFGKTISIDQSLEAIKEAVLFILGETDSKLIQQEEIRKTTEELYQKTVFHMTQLSEKLKASSEALENKQTEISSITEKVKKLENIEEDFNSFKYEHKKILENYSKLSDEYATLTNSIKNSSSESEGLKQKYDALQSQNLSLLRSIEESKKTVYDLNNKVNKLTIENEGLKETVAKNNEYIRILKPKETEVSHYSEALERLQAVLSRLETEVESKSNTIELLNQDLDELLVKDKGQMMVIAELNEKLRLAHEELTIKANESQAFKIKSQEELDKAQSMREEAQNLVMKIDDNVSYSEFLIDKRVISTFIVNFLNVNNTEKVRHQMLNNLSNMLSFDDTQKRKVGLIQDSNLFSQLASFITNG